ncbi:hypothetical protein BGW41_003831 [Actinomortierella wolfii]|nr:hypothetical protein BGW41_003831 [Actinomortierella wolfii]
MAPSASSNVNPQPGRLTPDQAIALGEVWSFLLHLWYCEPAHPGGRTNSHVVDDPYSLPTSPTTGSKWKSSGISSILVPTVEEKPSDATILPKLSPLNTCYYYLHRHLRAAEKTAAAAATEPATPTAAANPKSDAASLESELCETLAMRTMLNRQSAAKLRPWPSAHRDFKFKYTPAVYHDAFWAWVQNEHPDSIVIRSLKACRWKPIRAMEHLMLALEWRITHFLNELCLLEEDALDQRYNGFKYLLQRGTVAAPGYDLQGRPIQLS